MSRPTTRSIAVVASAAALTLVGGASATAQSTDDVTTVARVDVDGDRRTDRVDLVLHDDHDYTGSAELRVTLAGSGRQVRTTTDLPHLTTFDAHWVGTASMDGEPGAELVLMDDYGAHTFYHRVVTYRDGRLTTLQDPRSRYRWVTDGSVWSSFGYRAATSSTGKARMTSYEAVSEDGGRTFRRVATAAEWKNHRWSRLSQTTSKVSPVEAGRWGGWHVPGLPTGF